MTEKDQAKVAAAKARSRALTPEDRSAIARRAALARHNKNLPKAIAEGVLIIGDLNIACAVLDDAENTRVLTQEGFLTAIGRAGKAKGGEGASVDGLPAFLRAANLKPFISDDLTESTTPVEFVPLRGPGYQGRAFGYRASLLPNVCWVYQDALVARKLLPSQTHVGEACRFFLKALTNHAINDLVDIATGFEDMRKRRAIDKIIEKYVEKNARAWVQMFELDFYRHVFRLNGWEFDPENTARPGVVGRWTNDIYDRLAPGVRQALHERVKRNERGRPTQKLTQYLTPEEGKPELRRLLEGVKLLMRMSSTWDEFKLKLDEFYPRYDETMQLPFNSGVYRLPSPKDVTP
jgi:P63C domain-containing protein